MNVSLFSSFFFGLFSFPHIKRQKMRKIQNLSIVLFERTSMQFYFRYFVPTTCSIMHHEPWTIFLFSVVVLFAYVVHQFDHNVCQIIFLSLFFCCCYCCSIWKTKCCHFDHITGLCIGKILNTYMQWTMNIFWWTDTFI